MPVVVVFRRVLNPHSALADVGPVRAIQGSLSLAIVERTDVPVFYGVPAGCRILRLLVAEVLQRMGN